MLTEIPSSCAVSRAYFCDYLKSLLCDTFISYQLPALSSIFSSFYPCLWITNRIHTWASAIPSPLLLLPWETICNPAYCFRSSYLAVNGYRNPFLHFSASGPKKSPVGITLKICMLHPCFRNLSTYAVYFCAVAAINFSTGIPNC